MNIFAETRRIARALIKRPLHKIEVEANYQLLGTEYGSWPIQLDQLGPNSVVYSFGIGEDISFDIELIDLTGCHVQAFDPTPRSRAWVEKQRLPSNFHFQAIGIGDIDGSVEFFAPAVDTHVSFSSAPARRGAVPIQAQVNRLATIMAARADEQLDVLKMDIEGFEYSVITDIMRTSGIRPRQFLVEFHHGMYGKSRQHTREAVRLLRHEGYRIFYVSESGREYGLVHDG